MIDWLFLCLPSFFFIFFSFFYVFVYLGSHPTRTCSKRLLKLAKLHAYKRELYPWSDSRWLRRHIYKTKWLTKLNILILRVVYNRANQDSSQQSQSKDSLACPYTLSWTHFIAKKRQYRQYQNTYLSSYRQYQNTYLSFCWLWTSQKILSNNKNDSIHW